MDIIRDEIIKMVSVIDDYEFLDFIYKLLLSECG